MTVTCQTNPVPQPELSDQRTELRDRKQIIEGSIHRNCRLGSLYKLCLRGIHQVLCILKQFCIIQAV